MNSDKYWAVALVIVAFICAVVAIAIIAMDSFTSDEHNQLPRCDTVSEVLVGVGDFYNGRWDDYTCQSPTRLGYK